MSFNLRYFCLGADRADVHLHAPGDRLLQGACGGRQRPPRASRHQVSEDRENINCFKKCKIIFCKDREKERNIEFF